VAVHVVIPSLKYNCVLPSEETLEPLQVVEEILFLVEGGYRYIPGFMVKKRYKYGVY